MLSTAIEEHMSAPKVLTVAGTVGVVTAIVVFMFAPLAVDQIEGDLRPLTEEIVPDLPAVP
jgi:hypothetical protein